MKSFKLCFLILLFSYCSTKNSAADNTENPDTPQTIGSIERLDPQLEAILSKDAKIEILAEEFS